jgi:hypothetical protein
MENKPYMEITGCSSMKVSPMLWASHVMVDEIVELVKDPPVCRSGVTRQIHPIKDNT